jgi:hypothetical protein
MMEPSEACQSDDGATIARLRRSGIGSVLTERVVAKDYTPDEVLRTDSLETHQISEVEMIEALTHLFRDLVRIE